MPLVSALYPEEFSPLQPEEFASLQEMAKSDGPCSTSPAHVARFLGLGLIYIPPGTPIITPAGWSRLASGI